MKKLFLKGVREGNDPSICKSKFNIVFSGRADGLLLGFNILLLLFDLLCTSTVGFVLAAGGCQLALLCLCLSLLGTLLGCDFTLGCGRLTLLGCDFTLLLGLFARGSGAD